jgi:hypothetical protein
MANGWEEHSRTSQGVNLVAALLVHAFIGVPILVGVTGLAAASNEAAGVVWGICASGLWVLGVFRSARRRADFGAAWGAILGSWVLGALGPIGAVYAAYTWLRVPSEDAVA